MTNITHKCYKKVTNQFTNVTKLLHLGDLILVKNDLTPRELTFYKFYKQSGKIQDSAIKAGYSKKSASVQANRLIKSDRFKRFCEKQETKVQKSTGLTLEHMIEEIKDCKQKAEEAGNFSVVATCNQQLAKISGLLIDKQLTATTTPDDLRLELSKHFKVEVI